MSIESSIRKIKKSFVAGFGPTVVGAILVAGLITLGSKLPGDESGATAENATMRMQAKLALPIPTPPARP